MVSQNSLNNAILNNDFTVFHNNPAAAAILEVQNTSATANSIASVIISAGNSQGFTYVTYQGGSSTGFSHGVDPSDSNAFKLTNSAGLGGSVVLRSTTAGAVSIPTANFDVTRSASGADVSGTVSNSSNTASSSATEYLTVAGTSAGDARVQYAVEGTTTWTEGIDNSVAGDPFVLSASNALGTTNVMSAATSGAINYPLQPAFSASLSGNVVNATGDGTTYTIVFDTEQFDQGSNFGSNTFTAPVAGKYLFSYQISLANLGAAHTEAIVTAAGSNTLRFQPFVTQGAGGIVTLSGSIFVALSASATAIMQVTVSGSTKTVTVVGSSSGTTFQGYLVC